MREEGEKSWLETPLGRYVADLEEAVHAALIDDIFGYNAVQLGLLSLDLLRASRMPLRLRAGGGDAVDVACDPMFLPFSAASLDLVLLPHVLEFSPRPHQVLREVERVLIPEGHVVIAGFSPAGLWGLRRLAAGRRGHYPWTGRFFGLTRLKDWLALLGFEVVRGRFAAYVPPVNREHWLSRLAFLDAAGDRWWPLGGGLHIIVARKRVAGMRLIAPPWQKAARRAALAPATPLNQKHSPFRKEEWPYDG